MQAKIDEYKQAGSPFADAFDEFVNRDWDRARYKAPDEVAEATAAFFSDELFEEGWMVRAKVDEVLAEFDGWHDELLRIMRAIPADQCFKWALHVREPLDRWVNDRVALLGDAAHPMTPFLGLGEAPARGDLQGLDGVGLDPQVLALEVGLDQVQVAACFGWLKSGKS